MMERSTRGHALRARALLPGIALALAAALPGPLAAQQRPDYREPVRWHPDNVPHPNDLVPRPASPFQLQGLADFAMVGLRGRGNLIHTPTNDGGMIDYWFLFSSDLYIIPNTPNGLEQPYFMGPLWAGAPRGEWLRLQQLAPSLANATGGGYVSQENLHASFLQRPDSWRAADDQLGLVHSGATATTDGACTDFQSDFIFAGTPLAAASDCPATWGSDQFAGAQRLVPLGSWEQYFQDVGPEGFSWDWWQVPAEYVSDQLIGDFQSYHSVSDHTADLLAQFGSVIPGGAGEPARAGWPLGLRLKVDLFSFELPSVADATFYQALVINETEQVYGVPLDFDSLYIGQEHGFAWQGAPNVAQSAGVYHRPELGAVIMTTAGQNPGCNGATVIPGQMSGCDFPNGGSGAVAHIVLASPLGDLRNKLFSQEGSPFFAPGHPAAGDTITYNHGRMCDFGGCWDIVNSRSERAHFGLKASRPQDVLDGRDAGAFDALNPVGWWHTFRNHDFPNRTLAFNSWTLPEWDYDGDGVPNTLYLDSCLGPERGGTGCVEVFSDTLPGGLNNDRGNFGGGIVAGPFKLAAGDTTRFVVAMVAGATPERLMENVRNITSFYQNAYLGPSPPPPVQLVAVNTTPGDRGRAGGAQVQLFIDDTLEDFEDPFLNLLATQLEGTQIDEDNPGLIDAIRERAADNVDRLLVFKSCDAGTSFTADNDCVGDPLVDESGNPSGAGWRPWQIVLPDEDGNFPNVITDNQVTAGKTYMYSLVAVTRGFSPSTLERDVDGNLFPTTFSSAVPVLNNSLSISRTDPNVASVYVPASLQAGSAPASVTFVDADPFLITDPAAGQLTVQITGDVSADAGFRAVFGDSVVVERVEDLDAGTVATAVRVYDTVITSTDGETLERVVIEADTFTVAGEAGVSVSGGVRTETTDGTLVTERTVFDAPTLVLLSDADEPIFASSTLEVGSTTPGSLLGRPNFPQFIVDFDATLAGGFVDDLWFRTQADTVAQVRVAGEPNLDWLEAQSTAAADELGVYRVDWGDSEYGPAGLFRVNLSDPAQTEQAFQASLEARRVASTTSTSAEVAEALGVAVEDLVAVTLPFTVTNTLTDEEVTVAMLAQDKRETIPLGRLSDEIQVAVPEDIWVPGEQLVFLETRSVRETAQTTGGDTYVVLGADGQPVTSDRLVVTFSDAVLGCPDRATCNPLVARTPGANAPTHLPIQPGQYLQVRYASELDAATEFAFRLNRAVRGDEVTTLTRGDLDQIKVVPNPYVIFSTYEQARDVELGRLLFIGLPPEGTITIFTVSGQFIQRIEYGPDELGDNGDLFWDMRTIENNEIATGLYLFVVEGRLPASGQTVKKLGKFVVIR